MARQRARKQATAGANGATVGYEAQLRQMADALRRFSDCRGHVLFVDARKFGRLVDRTHREVTDDEVAHIARTANLRGSGYGG